MIIKKVFTVLCLLGYLISGNVFAHVVSMDLMATGETEMVMSDCGMMMNVSTNDETLKYNCFESCFGAYDDFLSTDKPEIHIYTNFVPYQNLIATDRQSLEREATNKAHAPPDGRCITNGKQTPYFSHKNTTQIL